jgi:hypothetical protein
MFGSSSEDRRTANAATFEFWQGLRSLNIDAVYERKDDSADAGYSSSAILQWLYSLGPPLQPFIRIELGPIRRVRIDVKTTPGEYLFEKPNSSFKAVYLAPDPRLASGRLSGLAIESVNVKNLPVVGRVIGTRWQGRDLESGIVDELNSLKSTNERLAEANSSEIQIRIDTKGRCWMLKVALGGKVRTPSKIELSCYRAIADCLLRANLD